MSTQTSFDLLGLRQAIESADRQYQLALYADNAEVAITDSTHPQPPEVLRGRSAIGSWIDQTSSYAVDHRVLDPDFRENRLRFTEEYRLPDGSGLMLDCTAEVRRGQITKESITVRHARPNPHRGARRGGNRPDATMVDEAPPMVSPAAVPGQARPKVRVPGLPGNFLG